MTTKAGARMAARQRERHGCSKAQCLHRLPQSSRESVFVGNISTRGQLEVGGEDHTPAT